MPPPKWETVPGDSRARSMIRAADRLSSGITVFEYFPGGFVSV